MRLPIVAPHVFARSAFGVRRSFAAFKAAPIPRKPLGPSLSIILLLALATTALAGPWLVPDAPFRAAITVRDAPKKPDFGYAIVVADFGAAREDLSDLVLFDSSGKAYPLSVVSHAPGRQFVVLAKGLAAGADYQLYFGGDRSRSRGSWMPKLSLLLETRRAPKSPKVDSWKHFEDEWKRANEIDGAGFVDSIEVGENPFGENTNFVSHFTGMLNTPEGAELYLYTMSSDASFVLVNGKYELGWPGVHAAGANAQTVTGTGVHTSSAVTQIDYYHYKGAQGSGPTMLLGWKKDNNLEPIPESAWLHPGRTSTGAIEHVQGWPVPIPTFSFNSYIASNNQFWYETQCSFSAQSADGWQAHWQFDDGSAFDGSGCKRILPGPDQQFAKLRLQRGKDVVEGRRKILFPDECTPASINSPADVARYVEAISIEPFARINAATLRKYLGFLIDYGSVQQIAPCAEAWLSKPESVEDPIWPDAQIARLQAMAQKDPRAALDALRSCDAEARRKYASKLDFYEIELQVFGLKNLIVIPTATQYAFQNSKTDLGKLARVRVGDLYRLTGKLTEAAEQYRSCQKPTGENIRKAPAQDRAFSITIANLIDDGFRNEARQKLIDWEIQNPMSKLTGDFLLLHARNLMMFGCWNEALAEIEAFQKVQPESPYAIDADFYRARALYELGRKEEAKTIWKAIVQNYPKHPMSAQSAEWAAK